jgi:hypothetical protein
MSQDIINPASAINLAEISAHPAEALAALMKFVRLQDEVIKTIQARQDSDFEHHARDILDHGQRLKKLEERESDNPTKKQTDRRDILKGLLVINGGRMFACDARKRIGLDEASFSRLVAKMGDILEVRKSNVNKRKNLLILRSEKG